MSEMSPRQRTKGGRRTRAHDNHLGDLFDIFPDLPRPFHDYTPKWMVMRHLAHVRAQVQAARVRAASIVRRHRLESDLRRAYLQRPPRR
jgi:hypothetical protein